MEDECTCPEADCRQFLRRTCEAPKPRCGGVVVEISVAGGLAAALHSSGLLPPRESFLLITVGPRWVWRLCGAAAKRPQWYYRRIPWG